MTNSVRGNLGVEADRKRLLACLDAMPRGPVGTCLNDELGPHEFQVLDGVLCLGSEAWARCDAAVPTIGTVAKASVN